MTWPTIPCRASSRQCAVEPARASHSLLAGRMFDDGVCDDHREPQTNDDASENCDNYQHDVTSRTEATQQLGTRPTFPVPRQRSCALAGAGPPAATPPGSRISKPAPRERNMLPTVSAAANPAGRA
jgi:hypothetical protein